MPTGNPSSGITGEVGIQPPLGVAHRALAHQLERHDRYGLLEDEALEVPEPTGVPRRHEPRLRGAAAAERHREHERAPGDVGMVRSELRVVDRAPASA